MYMYAANIYMHVHVCSKLFKVSCVTYIMHGFILEGHVLSCWVEQAFLPRGILAQYAFWY